MYIACVEISKTEVVSGMALQRGVRKAVVVFSVVSKAAFLVSQSPGTNKGSVVVAYLSS